MGGFVDDLSTFEAGHSLVAAGPRCSVKVNRPRSLEAQRGNFAVCTDESGAMAHAVLRREADHPSPRTSLAARGVLSMTTVFSTHDAQQL